MKSDISSNEKHFQIYVFLSAFARNLIEVYIPIILLKSGFSLREVVFYFLMAHLFSILVDYPCAIISKKYSNRILAIIGVVAFFILQFVLNFIHLNIYYLLIVSFLFALYRQSYWMSRRFYNFKVVRGEDISKKYSIISIINQLGVVVSAYIGSLILDYINVGVLTLIAIAIFLLSIIALYNLKFDHEKNSEKIHVLKTIKDIPIQNLYHFGIYELLNVLKFLFAIYIFIYIKDNYQTIGVINVVTNISIMLFSYFYGRYIDKKRNLLHLSILLTVLVYLCKANCVNYLIILVSFFEGMVYKMYEISLNSFLIKLSKKYEYYNYNLVYEIVINICRFLVILLFYIFNFDLRTMIYLTLIIIATGIFIPFNDDFKEKYKVIDKKC